MTMPAQRPHRSKQDYQTPPEFVDAVERRFGAIAFDLAANLDNAVRADAFYGPGSPIAEDALAEDWTRHTGTLWLNPEFGKIAPWAAKCALSLATIRRNADRVWRADWRVAMLTPASIGTDWFAKHVHRKALVLGISPRLQFVGADDEYPKDLMLSVFGPTPGFDCWRWS